MPAIGMPMFFQTKTFAAKNRQIKPIDDCGFFLRAGAVHNP
jgi:hypothetical protein